MELLPEALSHASLQRGLGSAVSGNGSACDMNKAHTNARVSGYVMKLKTLQRKPAPSHRSPVPSKGASKGTEV